MQCYYFSFRGKVVNFLLQPRIHGVGWSHVFEHVVNEAMTGLHHYQLLNIEVVIGDHGRGHLGVGTMQSHLLIQVQFSKM